MTETKLVCRLCGSDAHLAKDGEYRHAKQGWEDASTFCEKYGYPIPVLHQECATLAREAGLSLTNQRLASGAAPTLSHEPTKSVAELRAKLAKAEVERAEMKRHLDEIAAIALGKRVEDRFGYWTDDVKLAITRLREQAERAAVRETVVPMSDELRADLTLKRGLPGGGET